MGTDVIPFGKYKGHSVDEIAKRDPQYLQWLTGQAWFVERFQPVYQLVVNNFAPVSEETPAHNSMQVRFLEFDYQVAFIDALEIRGDIREHLREQFRHKAKALRRPYLTKCRVDRSAKELAKWELSRLAQHRKDIAATWKSRCEARDALLAIERRDERFRTLIAPPEFETDTDVEFIVKFTLDADNSIEACSVERRIAVEIKPSMGDDFPAVLRQIKRQGSGTDRYDEYGRRQVITLLIGEYAGMGATLDQVRQVFANAGITIVMAGSVRDCLTERLQSQN